ncbi:hypothetical protein D9Q98_007951 [Chlorella vulgaris]|uniref:Glycosyl transferase family 1 domain-containing protein n=1 Tax=Chlorella vulgaris TaxID=3077 RepID=A0A9D4YTN4_CHLVU|nr:hypothetical protein D9Q98_007951 [Chlorella vulgaris]
MRFVLLSLEFDAGTFSGNGIYACSQARSLAQLGHQVLVVAGAPAGRSSNGTATPAHPQQEQQHQLDQPRVLYVELPVWGCLDTSCGWREYAAGAGSTVAAEVAAFGAAAVLGVDWHSVGAYDALAAALPPGTLPPFVVYHRTAAGKALEMIAAREAAALARSCCSLVLSRSDAAYLHMHFPGAADSPLHVLLPALRSDMESLPPPQPSNDAAAAGAAATAAGGVDTVAGAGTAAELEAAADLEAAAWAAARCHLLCCVRVSPEKEPHRFVDVLGELQRRGSLQAAGVVPVMCGAGWGSDYGAALLLRLRQLVPQCVVHDSFLGPAEMAVLYASTLLNLHPPTYDAYGMTVVEAASQGAPSLVQEGGGVGATDLLSGQAGEVLLCNMEQPVGQLADMVEAVLADRARLAATGRKAMAKARSWTERDNAAALAGHVERALAGQGGGGAAGVEVAHDDGSGSSKVD